MLSHDETPIQIPCLSTNTNNLQCQHKFKTLQIKMNLHKLTHSKNGTVTTITTYKRPCYIVMV